jgi:hypothetical protein
MKTKAFLFVLPLAAALAFSCTRDILAPDTDPAAAADPSGLLVPFTAEAGSPQTKVGMKDGSTSNIVFSTGDQLLVNCSGIIESSILTLKSGAGERSAVFTGDLVLKDGKTEADLAGKRLHAVLLPVAGVEAGIFNVDPSTNKLTMDFSTGSIDSDLEALVSRTLLYGGETTYEAKKFEFELYTSYVKMNVKIPSEESDLARDYTVNVTYDWHMCAQASYSATGWGDTQGWNSTVTGTFHASSATGGTLYMAVMAGSGQRILDDSPYDDEVDFSISMDNVYKGYGLTGGSISKAVVAPGKGYTKSITLKDPDNEDVLLGQPESVRNRILTLTNDRNSNGYLSKYEAAQAVIKLHTNEDLTDATFFQYFTGMTTLDQTFALCKNLSKVVLPKHLTSIGEMAFNKCSNLSSVIIPSGVESILSHAFLGTALSRIIIPASVTKIEYGAFKDCASLKEVVLESSDKITTLESAVFSGCSSLEAFAIPQNVTEIGEETFLNCASLERVSIPLGVTSIGNRAFAACSVLDDVSIPNSVTSIGEAAFSGCRGLKTIKLPNRITVIADHTFNRCSSLASISIPETVTSIGEQAFDTCSSLETVTIPAAVEKMGYRAFQYCSSLATVYCYPTTPPKAINYNESNFFYACPTTFKLYVPSGSRASYYSHHDWSEWKNHLVEM